MTTATDSPARHRALPGPVTAAPAQAGRWIARRPGAVVVALLLVAIVRWGFRGLDFGFHWDEPVQLGLINQSIKSGTLLPDSFYNYPSLIYILSLIGTFPHVVTHMNSQSYQLTGAQFYVPVRHVFYVVTIAGGPFLYFAGRKLFGELAGTFAAVVYLTSWQLSYHAHWIAPDAILASATALFLLAVAWSWRADAGRFARYAPAIAAGIASASKYQGAILLLPVVLIVVVWGRRTGTALRTIAKRVAAAIGLALGTFIVITPGSVLQFNQFFEDIHTENVHYHLSQGVFAGAYPYDVHTKSGFAWDLFRFLTIALTSRSVAVSVIIVLLALVGLVAIAKRDRWLAAVFALPMIVMFLYFISLHVFIVRNFLLYLPFLAVLAGAGLAALGKLARKALEDRVSWSRPKVVVPLRLASVVVVFALLFTGSFFWLRTAANSVAQRGPVTLMHQTATWIDAHSADTIDVSGPLRASFHLYDVALPANTETGTAKAPDYYAFLYFQLLKTGAHELGTWPATGAAHYDTIGPDEVDFNYYPTWFGNNRVILLTPAQARGFGITDTGLHDLGLKATAA